MSPFTEQCPETFAKKLIGRHDMEDALKRLDKLTQEEARMAIAQNLKATHAVDERVRGVANTVVAVNNRVAGVDHRVACVDYRVGMVDNRVARVDEKVTRVDDTVTKVDENVKGIDAKVVIVDESVKAVDDKVAEVVHGAQVIFSQTSEMFNNFNLDPQTERKQRKSSNEPLTMWIK